MFERLIVAAFATWRITSLVLREDGPFDALVHLRTALGRVAGLRALTTCLWCLSLWTGILCAALALSDGWWLLLPFALSGAAIWLEENRVQK